MTRKPTKAELKRQKEYEELFLKFHKGNEAWARERIARGIMVYDAQSADYMTREVARRDALEAEAKRLDDAVKAEKQADKDALK